MEDYTLRFIEDFVLSELKTCPEQSEEDIADKFVRLHAESYERYLGGLEKVIQEKYSEEIPRLSSDDSWRDLKIKFLEAMRYYGLLGVDPEEASSRIMNLKILFTCAGKSTGGGNSITCDFLQTYKLQTDFSDGEEKYPFTLLTYGMILHEAGHALSSIVKAQTVDDVKRPAEELEGLSGIERFKKGEYYKVSYEERFAQGISKLVMEYLGFNDVFTAYYKRKESELQQLGKPIRRRIFWILNSIYNKTKNYRLLSTRSSGLSAIYGNSKSKSIEAYANPLSLEEIKERIS
jgi:hypothetical protein